MVVGYILDYNEDAGPPDSNLGESKILINNTISDTKKGVRFMSCNLKDFFPESPMKESLYMKLPIQYFLQDIIKNKFRSISGFKRVHLRKN